MLMIFVRKLGLWAASGLLKTMLLSLALVSAVVLVFGTPKHIKSVLKAENVYETARDTILEKAKDSASQQSDTQLPISDPDIQQIVKDAVPIDFLESSGNEVIDSLYAWLEGKTTKPEFSIETTEVRARFIVLLGDYTEKKYVALPICSKTEERKINPSEPFDPFNSTCRPSALSAVVVRSQLVSQLEKGDFFKAPDISSANLSKDTNGQTIFDSLSEAPKAYQFSQTSPLIFEVLALLMAAGVIFLHWGKRKGLRSVGISLVSTGVVLAGLSYLASSLFHKQIQPTGSLGKTFQSNSLQKSLAGVIDSLGQIFSQKLIWFGLAYSLIGIALILVAKYWKKQTKDEAKKKEDPAPPTDSTEDTTKSSKKIDSK